MNVACTFARIPISNVIQPVVEASNLASLPCDDLLGCCGIDLGSNRYQIKLVTLTAVSGTIGVADRVWSIRHR